MPIGIVQSVDPVKGTISVAIQGSGGTRHLPRVRLLDDARIPEHGARVVVLKDGRNYYYLGTPAAITPDAEQARAAEEHMPGDEWLGDPAGAHVRARSGGMVAAMADKVTGFIASKVQGIVQTLGKIISVDTTYYHKTIKTTPEKNTRIDTMISGKPRGAANLVEMVRSVLDTSDGTLVIDLSSFADIKAKVLINPASGNVTGASIGIEAQTPMGAATLSFDGATGNITVNSPGAVIKIDKARQVLVGSNGEPGDRVVRAKDLCWKTGAPIGHGSSRLYVGDGVL